MESVTTNVLLVEDDERLARLISDYLQRNGFAVVWETDGARAESRLPAIGPDLLILDIMLPGKNGLSLCRSVRSRFDGPILILTARDDDFDQVLGLETGADDYVVKPVEPRVLLARLHALLRRYRSATPGAALGTTPLRFGELQINPAARLVMLGDREVELSTHEFDLLVILARHAGEVVKRDDLYKALHGRSYNGLDRTVDVRISHLRRKLGDSAETPARIKTVWGRGYLFVPDGWIAR